MAAGDLLASFTPFMNEPPVSSPATLDLLNVHPVLDFDPAVDEYAVFTAHMPRNYGSAAALDVTICWRVGGTQTSGTVKWRVEFERMDTGTDLDSDSFDSASTSSAVTVPATAGQPLYTTIASIANSDADGIVAGEMFRLRVSRVVADDSLTDDASLLGVEVRQSP